MGDFRKGLAEGMAARGADAEPNQQAAAEGAEWYGQPPMNPNPPGPKALEIETGQAGLIGPVFDKIAGSLVDAFVKRAGQVYGE